jgi:hypothetical protein
MPKIYLLVGDEQQGPYSEEQISKMLLDGEITSETLFWQEGMSEWKTLAEGASQRSAPATIAPPRRSKSEGQPTVDFKEAPHKRQDLSARSKPITPGKAVAVFILFFILLTATLDLLTRWLPDPAKQFAERLKEIISQK